MADNNRLSQSEIKVGNSDSFFTHWKYRNSQEIDKNDNQLSSQHDLTLSDFDAALSNGKKKKYKIFYTIIMKNKL